MKLRARLIITLVVATFTCFLSLATALYVELTAFWEGRSRHLLDESASLAAANVNGSVEHTLANMRLLVSEDVLDRYLSMGEERYTLMYDLSAKALSRYSTLFPEYLEIVLLLPDGVEDIRIAEDIRSPEAEPAGESLFQQALQDPYNTYYDFINQERFDGPHLTFYRALYTIDRSLGAYENNKVVKGVLKFTVDMKWLMRHDPGSDATEVDATFIASRGRGVIYASGLSGTQARALSNTPGAGVDGPSQYMARMMGDDYLVDSRPLIGDWRLYNAMPFSEARSEFHRLLFTAIVVLVVVFVLLGWFIYVQMDRMIVRPVKELATATYHILHAPDKAKSLRMQSGEIGRLQQAFLEMEGQIRQYTRELKTQAYTDSLTGLPNRHAMAHMLALLMRRNEERDQSLALLFIDLDGFKQINDVHGHQVGDSLLTAVTGRLSSVLRPSDVIYQISEEEALEETDEERNILFRLGGDEFTIIVPNIGARKNAAAVAQRVLDQLRAPFKVEGQETFIGASIGIAMCPDDADSVNDLIKYADTAMYSAKAHGKMRFEFFSPQLEHSEQARLAMDNLISKALDKDEFTICFQPIIDLRTRHLAGFEALARLYSEQYGWVSPLDFVPAAEKRGMIDHITILVASHACEFVKALEEKYQLQPSVSLNITAGQLATGDVFDKINQLLVNFGMSRNIFEFEVTESALFEDRKGCAMTLDKLRNQGFRVSLDNFGVGYSSLSHLKKFSFNTLKIDRSFLRDLHDDEAGQAILSSIIAMARKMDMAVVAEGIETIQQLEVVESLGIHLAQGYLFSPPLPAEAALALYEQDSAIRY
ncbi:EAL domain-containing protein [Hahella sp. KA22]|uniref:putative bifunctional diguanylate cyclase/phosphodiesterase n=1 Tax=Hahella sp. KA22 TaxID=1628392 RepID=UPI000FDCFBEF|nr:EAL domain-containing protein [Hahella sp. KA22]AZZ93514.1 EAL domain-containing protein [Hahella sp. KA22]QAY56889.1 EAL domain-containing protein [Hahella sp. KA22]